MRFSAWRILIGIDSRRPASWLSAMLAASAMSMQPFNAMITASCAVMAAIGDLPKGFGISITRMGFLSRLVWPLIGMLIGACLWIDMTDSHQVLSVIVVSSVALLLMAAMLWAVLRQGVAAADYASICMLVGFTSVILGKFSASWMLTIVLWLSAIVISICFGHWRTKNYFSEKMPRRSVEICFGLISRTPARRVLMSIAMATMLFVMTGWLLLDPRQTSWAVVVGAMLMVCLSGPAVALGDGLVEDGDSSWAWLVQSSSWHYRWFDAVQWRRTTFETIVRYAIVLGWPALVASIVSLGSTVGPVPGMVVVGAIVVTGLVVLSVGFACQSMSVSRETSFALQLSILAPVITTLSASNIMNVLQRILSA